MAFVCLLRMWWLGVIKAGTGHRLKEVRGEGKVGRSEGDGVETLETEEKFIKEQARFFVEAADVGVTLIEPQQYIHGPFQFGEPDVKAGHAGRKR